MYLMEIKMFFLVIVCEEILGIRIYGVRSLSLIV